MDPGYCRCRSNNKRRVSATTTIPWIHRSEEHTSELQSHSDLVCRLLLEKKKHGIHSRDLGGAHSSSKGALRDLHSRSPLFEMADDTRQRATRTSGNHVSSAVHTGGDESS